VLVVDKVDEWRPAVAVVHIIAKSGSVNDRQVDAELLLLELRADDIDLDGLVELCSVALCVVDARREIRTEESVDDCVSI